ncbi:MAG: CopG family transcriptional regulator [Salibacteraceae bacterium]
MATYTSTLPDNLMSLLNEKAKELAIPKNKIIEKALSIYLNQIKKAEYIQSYKNLGKDSDILALAEEGMTDYFTQLENNK